jgi:manganese-dependent inorganic pyrophosphatase
MWKRSGTAAVSSAAVENRIYVTGHRNPDTDSIAAAVGYAELLGRLDPNTEYVPARLGEVNTQTRWVLERSGAPEPEFLPHIMLRVRDVMQEEFPAVRGDEDSVRDAGLLMAREDRDVLPVTDEGGCLVGVITERALARRYIRESRETSSLVEAPTTVREIVDVLEGEALAHGEKEVAGRVWVHAMDDESPTGIAAGDVVVTGDRPEVLKRVIDVGVALIVTSNGITPPDDVLEAARERDVAMVVSPLDSYVTGRMITLSMPCSAVMDRTPLTVRPDDLVDEISEEIKDIHYRAAVAVDGGTPVGMVTRDDLVNPPKRRVILVDHAEQAQSAPGIETAEIVEILDHHHIGSIETTVPVRATFDPVGSTATLVVERFRQNGMEPTRRAATLLLGAVLSDTVILNSPTTTDRDRAVVDYFERTLRLDAVDFGREMFESTADISGLDAEAVVTRDAKHYDANGRTICIAQIETVGEAVLSRSEELLEAMHRLRKRRDYAVFALMITDIIAKGTWLLVAGEEGRVERALGERDERGVIDLPGVMSRKKQVAPRLLDAM